MPERHTLCKQERVHSNKLIEELFGGGGSKSMSAYPVRVVYMLADRTESEPRAQMMVSVSKRHFKRAVKRNRVKRQLREAYRHHKHMLDSVALPEGKAVVMAFIWLDDNLHDSQVVGQRMKNLLERIGEKVCSVAVS